ncbi:MAG: hypothetical protein KC933_29705 [Myxococcales bacterium]|nr:hypothetical protein [Myxococcales bacterium]MCB9650910.1 hypothetical protein [Deltaproteobacteria bacterium]
MSLRTRLILMQVVLTVLLLGGIWLRLGSSFAGWSEEVVDAALHARFDALTAQLEDEHGRLELDDEDDDGGPFRITDGAGAVQLARGFTAYASLDETPGYRTATLPDGRAVRALTGTIQRRHHKTFVLTVARPTRTFTALSTRFLRGILVTLGVGVVLGALGSAILAALLVAPIRRLADEVAGLEVQALHHRISSPSRDPSLTQLTASFNGLLARLDEAFSRQRTFVARASHALKTPLATVLTQAEVALHRERDAAAYRRALEEIAASARESAAVVEGLLAASRADAAAEHLSPTAVPAAQLLDEAGRLFGPTAAQAGLTLELAASPGAVIHADPDRLREIIAALLDNAIRYTPAGGEVGLRVDTLDAGARVEVWDTGLGISESERGRVQERFFRGGAAEATGQPGTGLGLAVVTALAEAHHATLALEPRAGGGTRVVLEFPGELSPPGRGS